MCVFWIAISGSRSSFRIFLLEYSFSLKEYCSFVNNNGHVFNFLDYTLCRSRFEISLRKTVRRSVIDCFECRHWCCHRSSVCVSVINDEEGAMQTEFQRVHFIQLKNGFWTYLADFYELFVHTPSAQGAMEPLDKLVHFLHHTPQQCVIILFIIECK